MARLSADGRRFDLSKAMFFGVAGFSVVAAAFGVGLWAGARHTPTYDFAIRLASYITQSLKLTRSEAPTLLRIRPSHFLQAARVPGSGVTVNSSSNDQTDLVLLSSFFTYTNELRLIRRSG